MTDIPPHVLADADRQYAHVNATIDRLAQHVARQLTDGRAAVEAWALLGVDMHRGGDRMDTERALSFAVEVAAAAIVKLAQRQTDG